MIAPKKRSLSLSNIGNIQRLIDNSDKNKKRSSFSAFSTSFNIESKNVDASPKVGENQKVKPMEHIIKESKEIPLKRTREGNVKVNSYLKKYFLEFEDPLLEKRYLQTFSVKLITSIKQWAIINVIFHFLACIFQIGLVPTGCGGSSIFITHLPLFLHGGCAILMIIIFIKPKTTQNILTFLHGLRGILLFCVSLWSFNLENMCSQSEEDLLSQTLQQNWLAKSYEVIYLTSLYHFSGLRLKYNVPLATTYFCAFTFLSYYYSSQYNFNDVLSLSLETLIVCAFNFKCAHVVYWNEKRRRCGYLTRNSIIEERRRNNELLYEMIPEALVPKLLSGNMSESGAVCELYNNTTMLFVYITTYKHLVKTTNPLELVRFLNSLYSKLDSIIEGSEVIKMDNIGGTYIAVCGCPVPSENHCEAIAEAALNILELSKNGHLGVEVKIGIHSGTVASGILGLYARKWSIFSDTVNVASRMASSSESKHIQISAYSKSLLEKNNRFKLTSRGLQFIKGKGEMETFYLEGFNLPMRANNLFTNPLKSMKKLNNSMDDLFDSINSIHKLCSSLIFGTNFESAQLEKMFRDEYCDEVNSRDFITARQLIILIPMFFTSAIIFYMNQGDLKSYDNKVLVFLPIICFAFILNIYIVLSPPFTNFQINYHELFSGIIPLGILSSLFISVTSYMQNTSYFQLHIMLVVLANTGFRLRYSVGLITGALITTQAIIVRYYITTGTTNYNSEILAEFSLLVSMMVSGGIFTYFLEATEHLEMSHRLALDGEKESFRGTLESLLPTKNFTERLLSGEDVTQELNDVTYLYSDLVGYTDMSSHMSPIEIMVLLNRLYCRFEKHLSSRGVYKLDAVGDAFIVIGGLSGELKNFNHCDEIVLYAIDMLRELEDLKETLKKESGGNLHPAVANLKMRIGIHTGKGVAGVIGKRRPRVLVWGLDAAKAEYMESHGVPNAIHMSDDSQKRLSSTLRKKLHFEVVWNSPDTHSYFDDRCKQLEAPQTNNQSPHDRIYSKSLPRTPPAKDSTSGEVMLRTYIVRSRDSKRESLANGLLGLGLTVGTPKITKEECEEPNNQTDKIVMADPFPSSRLSVMIPPPLVSLVVRKPTGENFTRALASPTNQSSPFARMSLISPTLMAKQDDSEFWGKGSNHNSTSSLETQGYLTSAETRRTPRLRDSISSFMGLSASKMNVIKTFSENKLGSPKSPCSTVFTVDGVRSPRPFSLKISPKSFSPSKKSKITTNFNNKNYEFVSTFDVSDFSQPFPSNDEGKEIDDEIVTTDEEGDSETDNENTFEQSSSPYVSTC